MCGTLPSDPEQFKGQFPELFASAFKKACVGPPTSVGPPTQGDAGYPVMNMLDMINFMAYWNQMPARKTSKFAAIIMGLGSDSGQLMLMLKDVMQNNLELVQQSFRPDHGRLQSIKGLATPPLQQGSFPGQFWHSHRCCHLRTKM